MHVLSLRIFLVFLILDFFLVGVLAMTGTVPYWAWFALSAVLFVLLWCYDHWQGIQQWVVRRVEPFHLIAAGLAGVIFFAAIALIGVLLQFAEAPSGGLSSRLEALQADFDKYVRPRQITDEQRDGIVRFLLERKPPGNRAHPALLS